MAIIPNLTGKSMLDVASALGVTLAGQNAQSLFNNRPNKNQIPAANPSVAGNHLKGWEGYDTVEPIKVSLSFPVAWNGVGVFILDVSVSPSITEQLNIPTNISIFDKFGNINGTINSIYLYNRNGVCNLINFSSYHEKFPIKIPATTITYGKYIINIPEAYIELFSPNPDPEIDPDPEIGIVP